MDLLDVNSAQETTHVWVPGFLYCTLLSDARQRETRDTHSNRRPSVSKTQSIETSGKEEEDQRNTTKTSKEKQNRDEKESVKHSPRVKSAVRERKHGILNEEIKADGMYRSILLLLLFFAFHETFC